MPGGNLCFSAKSTAVLTIKGGHFAQAVEFDESPGGASRCQRPDKEVGISCRCIGEVQRQAAGGEVSPLSGLLFLWCKTLTILPRHLFLDRAFETEIKMHSKLSLVLAFAVVLTACAIGNAQRRRGFRLLRKNCKPCFTQCAPSLSRGCTLSQACPVLPQTGFDVAGGDSVCPLQANVYQRQVIPSSICGCGSRIAGNIIRPIGPPGTMIPGSMLPKNGFIQEPSGRLIPSSPFSLSGYVIPPVGANSNPPGELSNLCEQAFLACCASGAPNCVGDYFACCALRGETVLHTRCPVGGPGGGGGEASEAKAGPEVAVPMPLAPESGDSPSDE